MKTWLKERRERKARQAQAEEVVWCLVNGYTYDAKWNARVFVTKYGQPLS